MGICVGSVYRDKDSRELLVVTARTGAETVTAATLDEFGDMTQNRIEFCAEFFADYFEVVS
jgi:hypothetical protein